MRRSATRTASGLEADLRRCLTERQSHGRIDPFPLGTDDLSGRLLIPEKLYRRKREVNALVAAFDRVVAHGTAELRERYASLSLRERQVMALLVVSGLLNKQVGSELGISEITVKARGRMMQKIKAAF
jgi:DNA-binding NarL/FixJ family response regulator